MPPVINYETIGELSRLPAEILGLIFAQLSPIQQFKINVDPVLCATFNQARDYTILTDISDRNCVLTYLLYALSDIYNKIDINKAPEYSKSWISKIAKKENLYINICRIFFNVFNFTKLSEVMFDTEYSKYMLNEYDTDIVYSRLGTIIYPILEQNKQSSDDYAIVRMLYILLLQYAFFSKPTIFIKHFANKDSCDNMYHIIVNEVSKYIRSLLQQRCFCIIARAKFVEIQRTGIYKPYIIRASIALDVYLDTNTNISILERVFSEPRLEKYRAEWVNKLAEDKTLAIEFFNAVRNSPLLCHHIKWLYVKIGNNVEIMYTNQQ